MKFITTVALIFALAGYSTGMISLHALHCLEAGGEFDGSVTSCVLPKEPLP